MTANAPTTDRATSAWTIDDAHSHVAFAVKHMMIATVRGRFGHIEGTLELDERDITRSRVDVMLESASIETHNGQRDAHLRSADFLAADEHPAITFRSTAVERLSEDRLRVSGDLTIRGVTRPADLDVRVLGSNRSPWGQEMMAFSARTVIDRREFGLTWNQALETGGVLVANDVRIDLEIEAVKQD